MATSSIFENIHISDASEARSLLESLEEAERAAEGRARPLSKFKELKSEAEIEDFFSKYAP